MNFEEIEAETLWLYYQKGYTLLLRSGRFFRQVVRPALSHVYFFKVLPLLQEYSRANHGAGELPPGFGTQMEAHSLTARDLLHLDYAISLGYVETFGIVNSPVLGWPGPDLYHAPVISADARPSSSPDSETEEEEDPNSSFV